MGDGEVQVITRMMDSHQKENRAQLSELRESTSEIAKGLSTLATTIAKVEERHARHDDGMKRMGKQVDDHETRIRVLENNKSAIKGGWKTLTVIGGTVLGLITVFYNIAGG